MDSVSIAASARRLPLTPVGIVREVVRAYQEALEGRPFHDDAAIIEMIRRLGLLVGPHQTLNVFELGEVHGTAWLVRISREDGPATVTVEPAIRTPYLPLAFEPLREGL